MGIAAFNETYPISQAVTWLISDGTTAKNCFDGTPQVARCDLLLATNKGATPRTVAVFINEGAGYTPIGTVIVPANTGYLGSAPIDLLAAVLPAAYVGLPLDSRGSIVCQPSAAVAADNDLQIVSIGGYVG